MRPRSVVDMGERIFKPGIRTSDKAEALIREGGWMAQVAYDWLITLVDDFGRYDARPSILRCQLFPLLLDVVRESDMQRALLSMHRAGLVRLYQINGKPFLEITKWKQRMRAEKSKWPAPDGQCHDIDMTMPTETETETETEKNTGRSASRPARKKPPKARKVSPIFGESKAYWMKHWAAKYGRDYYWGGAKDANCLNKIIAYAKGDIEAVQWILDGYLADNDPFPTRRSHELSSLNVNTYGASIPPPAKEFSVEELKEIMEAK